MRKPIQKLTCPPSDFWMEVAKNYRERLKTMSDEDADLLPDFLRKERNELLGIIEQPKVKIEVPDRKKRTQNSHQPSLFGWY